MSFYKLILRYDGTRFSGWQFQPGRRTVQGVVEKAIRQVSGERVRIRGASRTDAGVHALAQIAVFESLKEWEPQRLKGALNAVLPADVAVTNVRVLSKRIDPTRASSKLYHYKVWNHAVRDPLLLHRAWWVRHPLDVRRMRRALRFLVGRHDFSSFADSDRTTKTSVRRLKKISLQAQGNLLVFALEADGFLKGMVRNLVGTAVEIGRGRLTPEDSPVILRRRDRRAAGPQAPACGLYLVRVSY